MSHCHSDVSWYKKPLYATLIVTIVWLVLSAFIPVLQPSAIAFFKFWQIIWWAVLLGFIISGIIDALVPRQYVSHYLAKPGFKGVANAAILGFIMSVCSHGILAIAVELYKKGSSTSAVVTFLLASPWANIAMTFMLFAFFGWMALLFVMSAIVIAIITGLGYEALMQRQLIPANPNTLPTANNFSVKNDMTRRYKAFDWRRNNIRALFKDIAKGAWVSAHMVLWWVLIGTILGSLIEAYVPHHIFHAYFGQNFIGLMMTLVAATVIEVCSEGSAPIAFSIYQQTQAFGNVFIFLMAGVITDFTEIGLIWSHIGKRAAICLPFIAVPQTLLLGYVLNLVK